MSLGTFEGMVPAYGRHDVLPPKAVKQSPSEAKAAYNAVTRRDDETCVRCRREGVVQRDHRQNRMPGNTTPSNLQLLCPDCHEWKTNHPKDAVQEGWAVPRHTTLLPSDWPARRWIRTHLSTYRLGWVLYFDEPEHGRWFLEIADIEATYRRKAGGVV